MKKLVLLITVLVMIFLTAACGKGAVTTSPDTTAQPKETSTEAPTTQDPTTVETVFNTAQIQAITLYGQYGQGEGNKVTDENLSAVIAWLETFVIDKEVDDQPLPPGTNTYRLEIEYRDGSVVKTGLDVVEINGRSYYVKHGDLPECFETVLSESIVTTEPKLVAVYPEQYEAVSVSSSSCKVGSYYDNASRYDAQKRIENTETVRGADMPTDLRESGLTASSSEADFIAHAKKILYAYVSDEYGCKTLLAERQSEQRGSWTFYNVVFYRGDTRAKHAEVSIRSDGLISSLTLYKALYLDRFGEINLHSEALTAVVDALQHENQTKKTTSLLMGKTHLYLAVNIDHETYYTDFDEEGNPVLRLDEMGYPIVDEHLRHTYYILLAELVEE